MESRLQERVQYMQQENQKTQDKRYNELKDKFDTLVS